MKKQLLTLSSLLVLGVSLTSCGGASSSVASSGSNFDTSKKIQVYTRDTTSGTRDGFFTKIGFSDAISDNSKLASGYVEVASNGDMMTSIKQDEYAIGYISLATLSSSGLIGLTYEGVKPTEENVLNETYKLTRNFNYVTRATFANDTVKNIVEAFTAFLTTKDAKTTIQGKDGIVEIKDSDPTWDSIKDNYAVTKLDNSSVTVKFGGSTSVEKIAKALTSEFSAKCGNFKAEHNHTGSGDAFKRTQGSEKDSSDYLDIGFLSRELKSSEAAADGTSSKICTDAIVAVVNSKNTYTTTTAADLKSIFDGTCTTWSQIIK
jgi:phosphate transport system substrate-binding protein